MALLSLVIAVVLVVGVTVKSVSRSQFPFRTLAIQIPLFILTTAFPLGIVYVYLYSMSVSASEAASFGRTYNSEIVLLSASIEELAKLTGLLALSRWGNLVLSFFTRMWVGLTFGLCELFLKLFGSPYLHAPLGLRSEWFALAFLTVGLHCLTCYYPNSLRRWQTVFMLVLLVAFHFTYNTQMLKIGMSQQAAGDSIQQAMSIAGLTWILLGFAYFATLGNTKFTVRLWK